MGQIEKKVEDLELIQKTFLKSSKSENTKKAYRSDWNLFCKWCNSVKISSIPATPHTISLYISYMADQKKSVSTISRTLTSISQAHEILSFASPTTHPEVVETFKGIRRKLVKIQKKSKALIFSDLKKVISNIEPSFIGKRDKALIFVGWTGALRRSEIVRLNFEDVEFVPEGMIVTIRKSKTDQESIGYKIGIPNASLLNKEMCPVSAMKNWLEISDINTGAIFYTLGPTATSNKFFVAVDKKVTLSEKSVTKILKKRIKNAGLSEKNYSSHSLRSGFITSMAKCRIPEYEIQLHTRHRSSKALRGYIREGNLFCSNPLSILL
jgi:site-specific recombinase XerD